MDRQGAGVTRAQIFAALYEEGEYDRSMQKQLDVIIRSMRETLEEYGVSEIVDLARGELRVVPTFFPVTCMTFWREKSRRSCSRIRDGVVTDGDPGKCQGSTEA